MGQFWKGPPATRVLLAFALTLALISTSYYLKLKFNRRENWKREFVHKIPKTDRKSPPISMTVIIISWKYYKKFSNRINIHFAFSFVSHMANTLFSVSVQNAKKPIPGTGVLFLTTFPPNFSILEQYSSTDFTSM